jgi:hypothetical protein
MTKWQPIDTAPENEWVLIRGGQPGYGWDGADIPPMVVALTKRYDGEVHWFFAHYDSGYYGEWDNPTEWLSLSEVPE